MREIRGKVVDLRSSVDSLIVELESIKTSHVNLYVLLSGIRNLLTVIIKVMGRELK